MEAAKLLVHQANVDHGTAKMLCDVLEHAWASVQPQFEGHLAKIRGAVTIANSLITLADQGERDPLVLRAFALSRVRELLEPPHADEK